MLVLKRIVLLTLLGLILILHGCATVDVKVEEPDAYVEDLFDFVDSYGHGMTVCFEYNIKTAEIKIDNIGWNHAKKFSYYAKTSAIYYYPEQNPKKLHEFEEIAKENKENIKNGKPWVKDVFGIRYFTKNKFPCFYNPFDDYTDDISVLGNISYYKYNSIAKRVVQKLPYFITNVFPYQFIKEGKFISAFYLYNDFLAYKKTRDGKFDTNKIMYQIIDGYKKQQLKKSIPFVKIDWNKFVIKNFRRSDSRRSNCITVGKFPNEPAFYAALFNTDRENYNYVYNLVNKNGDYSLSNLLNILTGEDHKNSELATSKYFSINSLGCLMYCYSKAVGSRQQRKLMYANKAISNFILDKYSVDNYIAYMDNFRIKAFRKYYNGLNQSRSIAVNYYCKQGKSKSIFALMDYFNKLKHYKTTREIAKTSATLFVSNGNVNESVAIISYYKKMRGKAKANSLLADVNRYIRAKKSVAMSDKLIAAYSSNTGDRTVENNIRYAKDSNLLKKSSPAERRAILAKLDKYYADPKLKDNYTRLLSDINSNYIYPGNMDSDWINLLTEHYCKTGQSEAKVTLWESYYDNYSVGAEKNFSLFKTCSSADELQKLGQSVFASKKKAFPNLFYDPQQPVAFRVEALSKAFVYDPKSIAALKQVVSEYTTDGKPDKAVSVWTAVYKQSEKVDKNYSEFTNVTNKDVKQKLAESLIKKGLVKRGPNAVYNGDVNLNTQAAALSEGFYSRDQEIAGLRNVLKGMENAGNKSAAVHFLTTLYKKSPKVDDKFDDFKDYVGKDVQVEVVKTLLVQKVDNPTKRIFFTENIPFDLRVAALKQSFHCTLPEFQGLEKVLSAYKDDDETKNSVDLLHTVYKLNSGVDARFSAIRKVTTKETNRKLADLLLKERTNYNSRIPVMHAILNRDISGSIREKIIDSAYREHPEKSESFLKYYIREDGDMSYIITCLHRMYLKYAADSNYGNILIGFVPKVKSLTGKDSKFYIDRLASGENCKTLNSLLRHYALTESSYDKSRIMSTVTLDGTMSSSSGNTASMDHSRQGVVALFAYSQSSSGVANIHVTISSSLPVEDDVSVDVNSSIKYELERNTMGKKRRTQKSDSRYSFFTIKKGHKSVSDSIDLKYTQAQQTNFLFFFKSRQYLVGDPEIRCHISGMNGLTIRYQD